MPNPRKSVARKRLRGTNRPDRRPKRDFSARLMKVPPPPKHLSERAATEWRALAPVVVGIGTLTLADCRAFALLAEILATETEAREMLEEDGLTVPAANGGRKGHPAIKIMEVARSQAIRGLADFGLTPKGRQGIDTAPLPRGQYEDDLEAFLNSGP